MSHPKRQELIRLSPVDRVGHHAILERIKARQVSEIAAPLTVDPIVLARLRVINKVGIPIRRGVARAIDFGDNVLPVSLEVLRARK